MSRTALVTGGSGALGRAIVARLRRDGYEVAFTYRRNLDAAKTLAAETGALALSADLTHGADAQRVVDETRARVGPIDVLVNNAGETQVMPFALIEEEDWEQILAANLKTMFTVTHAVVRLMIERRQGAIVNIGSLAGHRLLEVPVHYATAKAGVAGFTLSLARELARYRIRVNSVVPGLLEDGVSRLVPDKERSEYLRYCLAGREGRMDEVAAVVAFLASEDASYINGQQISVDGGI